jgi:hypothetical protein
MIREVNDPSPLRMPSTSGSQTADARKIDIVGNPPKLHIMGSGKDSVINLLEHFADDGSAEFVPKEVDRSLSRQRRVRTFQPRL